MCEVSSCLLDGIRRQEERGASEPLRMRFEPPFSPRIPYWGSENTPSRPEAPRPPLPPACRPPPPPPPPSPALFR